MNYIQNFYKREFDFAKSLVRGVNNCIEHNKEQWANTPADLVGGVNKNMEYNIFIFTGIIFQLVIMPAGRKLRDFRTEITKG